MRRRLAAAALLAAAATVPAVPAQATPQNYTETTLWDSTAGPRVNYHVQGLTVLPDDTVLAFAEGRYQTCDAGPRDIELRRSTDGGKTFSASQIVVPSDGVTESFGNPTALVDARTHTTFLFYNESFRLAGNTTCSGDSARVFYRTSRDDGRTWSGATEITDLFTDNPYGWTLHGPGPGHGIQLADGRLVVQMAHRRPILGTTATTRMYGLTDVYSDDNGRTWHESAPVPVSADYPINESRIVQRADGSIVVNGRYAAGGTHDRISSVSTDGGLTWSAPVFDTATGQFSAIDAGFARYSGGPGSRAPDRILFSRPDATNRSNMTVSVSYDEGYSYPYSRVANPGPSFYSDLAVLRDGTILMLYGRDGTSASVPQDIVMARFNLAWLTDGADGGRGAPPVREATTELGTTRATGTVPSTVVPDANARGGHRLDATATQAGDYVDIPFTVRNTGTYRLDLRYYRTADDAAVTATVDGQPAGDPFDPTMKTTTAYQLYPLGTATLSPGRHTLRVTATGPGSGGGWRLAPDDLTLTTTR